MWLQTMRLGRLGLTALLAGLLSINFTTAPAAAQNAEQNAEQNTGQNAAEQGEQREPQRAERERGQRHEQRQERGRRLIRARLLQDIGLTDEQQSQVDRAFEAHYQQVRQWHQAHRDELRELIGQFRALDREDDSEQLEALRERARELMEQRPGLDELGDALEAVLSDEQWERFEDNRDVVQRRITEHMRRTWNAEGDDDDAEADRGRERRGEREGRRRGPRADGRPGPLFEGVDLTDDQRQRLREAGEAHREQVRAWREAHREELRELRRQMGEAREEEDRQRLRELREQLGEMREDRPTRDDLHARYEAILDDEQWERFQRNWQELRQRMQQRHEQRGDQRGEARERRERGGEGERRRGRGRE